MSLYAWDQGKSLKLIKERGISFEEVILAIQDGRLLETVDHPNPSKYQNQKIFVVLIRGDAYLVPFIEDGEKIFLKTIFPSRKARKKYLEGGNQ